MSSFDTSSSCCDSETDTPRYRTSGEVSFSYISFPDWDQTTLRESIEYWLKTARESRPKFYQEICSVNSCLPYLSVFSSAVEMVYRIGEVLNLTNDVQFLALDLFDGYNMKLYDKKVSKYNETIFKEPMWNEFKNKTSNEYLLRLLSCIQLASKYMYTSNVNLDNKIIKRWLDRSKSKFNINDIRKSEIQVFKILDCSVGKNNNVLFYVECLLYVAIPHTLIDSKQLYSTAVQVLSVAYLKRQEIYHKLLSTMTQTWEKDVEQRLNFLPVQCDYLLLAAGVVLTSISVQVQDDRVINSISTTLADYIQLPKTDLRHLCKIMLHVILI